MESEDTPLKPKLPEKLPPELPELQLEELEPGTETSGAEDTSGPEPDGQAERQNAPTAVKI